MEKYYRRPKSLNGTELTFQCIEWSTSDYRADDAERDEYVIRAFGVTQAGYSVCCSFYGYKPFFYVKVERSYTRSKMRTFVSGLERKLGISPYYSKELFTTELVMRKDMYGYHGDDTFKFIKMVFNTQKAMKAYMYKMKNDERYSLYETNIDPLLKFYHITGIQPSNWVSVKNVEVDDEISTCQMNIRCKYSDVSFHEKDGNAPILQASYDIETYSSPETDESGNVFYPFPVPEKMTNEIYQIATCFKRVGEPGFVVKHLITLKKCEAIPSEDVVVWECETEAELLVKWKRVIELMDPDILYQYNGDIFDCNYMVKRAEMLGVSGQFMDVSRLLDEPAKLVEKTFSSGAYGTTNFKRLSIPGRVNFDILIFIKREYKENSYKLDNVSQKYLGEKKNDVSPQDIFRAYEEGTPAEIRRIGEYCIQDTLLPQKLVDTLHILQTQVSMSNVTLVPIKFLIERGQEVKALSQISKKAQEKGFLLPRFEYSTEPQKYEGATVLEVEKPEIYNVPITVLDFASLYPSIIRAHGLCYSTIVLEDKYKNLPGVEYFSVKVSINDEPERDILYAKGVDAILPDLLAELGVQRKAFKKLMAKETDPLVREIYNKTQLAYKVSMNSVYGILGSRTIGCVKIAATVTKVGREMIRQTKEFIESNHHCVFPEGHGSTELEAGAKVRVRMDTGEELEVYVEDLETLKPESIKTVAGWRKFHGVECV